MFKRNFVKLLLCCSLLFLSSCITKYLWGGKTYEEKINQFLIGEDGRYIVMLGQYHYVLTDDSRIFSRIITLKQSGILTIDPKRTNLQLNRNNEISGYLTISGYFSLLPIEDIGYLRSLGYAPTADDIISIKIDIKGRRYLARNLGQNLLRSGTTYNLTITYYDSNPASDIGKAAITPIAVGLDAVLLIGKVIVYPFSF